MHSLTHPCMCSGDVRQRKERKLHRIRTIAGSVDLTTSECLYQYKMWPNRQRACARRLIDRVLCKTPTKQLSAWRKLLRGKWMTAKGIVELREVNHKGHKLLQWCCMRDGIQLQRLLRVRKKTHKDGVSSRQFALAGGSDSRVQMWLVNATTSTDDVIVWRAHTSSFCKLVPVQEIEYTRIG